MNNIVDLHTLSHQIHRENILNLKSHFFVQFRYKMFLINAILYIRQLKLIKNRNLAVKVILKSLRTRIILIKNHLYLVSTYS